MTEILLNAILNLFAIQASMLSPESMSKARAVISDYLHRHLHIARDEDYLDLFDTAIELHRDVDGRTRLERAGRVASNLKVELPRFEQHIFLMRFVELATRGEGEEAAMSVAQTVARELAIDQEELEELFLFCRRPFDAEQPGVNFLIFDPESLRGTKAPAATGFQARHVLARPDFKGKFAILRIPDISAFFVTAAEDYVVTLDSLPLGPGMCFLPPGAVLRDISGAGIYYSEIESAFFARSHAYKDLFFCGEDLEFHYPGSDAGLHQFNFSETGGRMVGIMGVSGAGKSTLLGLLIGQYQPDSGRVLINGLDVHRQTSMLEGVTGYVPQDDLLFEDLTVFDNLYYNASLCLANLPPEKRRQKVEELLEELNQLNTRDLKVGSPLEKTISGGQRKRLNIALELIREPSILIVDEPTSGLSSSDSENVMTLLKAQAAKGKLVIVVIHQPSSRIFKMFDALWILDQGGRPIYNGNPLDAIIYFRSAIHQAGMDEYACPHCGHVNPEQIFEIIEARIVDKNGHYTKQRRISPEEWRQRYLTQRNQTVGPRADLNAESGKPENRLWRPGRLGQFSVFFLRNLKARLANRQYLTVALLEPPLLALLAAILTRGARGGEYIFMENGNLGAYFFISVIVALFLGLSISAEEINRDRKILQRERFLHLSWPCYIASKAIYLILVAAIQTALFTIIGNPILEIPDMFLTTWIVLFSCSVTSCLLSLNISATFKSAVTIYILIPLLLVPQMLLGGSVIPFDDLIHKSAGNRDTPVIANLMPSRWGYEALAVEQYVSNRFMNHFFDEDCAVNQCDYIIDIQIPEMRGLADFPFLDINI
ncbi:MAG: ATP-binding cassette domain-containing protein, partial [Deltaproteobacteria bacterium]|nr:ATP-binding cassette domain-containing protein [Deltaproteobacteria bacterium]